MTEMAQQSTTITPFWKGVFAGIGIVLLWSHRGWIFRVVRGVFTSSSLRGAFDAAKLAVATGIEMPSSDPAIAFRQMRRYAFAASQDKSPIVGLTHASYSLIALDILEEAVGRDKLLALGCDPQMIRTSVARLQDMHGKKLEACDPYLSAALAMEQQGGRVVPGFDGVEYIAPTGA
jgi:hypothetical protein